MLSLPFTLALILKPQQVTTYIVDTLPKAATACPHPPCATKPSSIVASLPASPCVTLGLQACRLAAPSLSLGSPFHDPTTRIGRPCLFGAEPPPRDLDITIEPPQATLPPAVPLPPSLPPSHSLPYRCTYRNGRAVADPIEAAPTKRLDFRRGQCEKQRRPAERERRNALRTHAGG